MLKLSTNKQIDDFCALGEAVITTEARAVSALTSRLDTNFSRACEYMFTCKGRVIVMGMGKSGHIGHKIAATLASTGTPAFFVHPGEANHGDMGMITALDVILAISYSGHTEELLTLLPLIKRLDVPLVALTGNSQSQLAKNASVHIDISIEEEACPLGLAPTTSTTVSLVMGDALAIALLNKRGFSAEDFALSHPGGTLGRRLLLRVHELMHTEEQIPIVTEQTLLSDALLEVTQKKLGMTCIVNAKKELIGIFTDGDLRRALDKNIDIHTSTISVAMTKNCKTITPDMLAIDALKIMERHKITSLVAVNDYMQPIGVIHMHDLLQAKVV